MKGVSMEAKTHVIHFEVDGEDVETTSKEPTVREIIALGGEDPDTHYLQLVHGGRPGTAFKDLDATVKVHEGIEFVTVFTGPTHVS